MLAAFVTGEKGPNPKKGPNLKKTRYYAHIIDLGGGTKVFPNSQHDKSVDVSRRLVENIIFSFLVGQKFEKSLFRPDIGRLSGLRAF